MKDITENNTTTIITSEKTTEPTKSEIREEDLLNLLLLNLGMEQIIDNVKRKNVTECDHINLQLCAIQMTQFLTRTTHKNSFMLSIFNIVISPDKTKCM